MFDFSEEAADKNQKRPEAGDTLTQRRKLPLIFQLHWKPPADFTRVFTCVHPVFAEAADCPFDDLTYFVSVKVLADPIFEETAPDVACK